MAKRNTKGSHSHRIKQQGRTHWSAPTFGSRYAFTRAYQLKITKSGVPPFTSSSLSSSRAFFFFSSFFSIIVDVFISGSYVDYSSP